MILHLCFLNRINDSYGYLQIKKGLDIQLPNEIVLGSVFMNQYSSFYQWSNLGTIIIIKNVESYSSSQFVGIAIFIVVLTIVMILTLFSYKRKNYLSLKRNIQKAYSLRDELYKSWIEFYQASKNKVIED